MSHLEGAPRAMIADTLPRVSVEAPVSAYDENYDPDLDIGDSPEEPPESEAVDLDAARKLEATQRAERVRADHEQKQREYAKKQARDREVEEIRRKFHLPPSKMTKMPVPLSLEEVQDVVEEGPSIKQGEWLKIHGEDVVALFVDRNTKEWVFGSEEDLKKIQRDPGLSSRDSADASSTYRRVGFEDVAKQQYLARLKNRYVRKAA